MDSKVAELQIDVTKIYNSESEMAKFGKRITQSEVEGQLKVMKQRRLSRMNILDDEDSEIPVEKNVITTPNVKSTVETFSRVSQISEHIDHKYDKIKVLSTFRSTPSNNKNPSDKSFLGEICKLPQVSSAANSKLKPEQRKTIYYKENEDMSLDLKHHMIKHTSSDSALKMPANNVVMDKEPTNGVTEDSSVPDKVVSIVSKVPSFNFKLTPNQRRSDKVFKKFQMNWNNLNDILENKSEVDMDELKDLKNSLEDVTSLITKYKEGLERLEQMKVPAVIDNKLDSIKCQVEKLKHQIKHFRGLKRDSGYLLLSNKLSNIFLEINKMSDSSISPSEKKEALAEINAIVRDLEAKVRNNQSYLEFILNEQVLCVRNNHNKLSSMK